MCTQISYDRDSDARTRTVSQCWPGSRDAEFQAGRTASNVAVTATNQ